MMKPTKCPGCLKQNQDGYCKSCRKRLFNGKAVSPTLSFSRPEFNRVKTSQKGRISISGVQVKHSLKLNGNNLELTDKDGEYILKPIPNDTFDHLREMPANEHLTMQLSRQIFNINAAENAMIFFNDGEPAYITKRFDRGRTGLKLHQEDFAQLSKKTEESNGEGYKYTGSYEEIADLMQKFVGPYAIEVEKFFERVVFNYLILNGDAHLKNFSVFRDEGADMYLLTPAYDLINTRIHLIDEPGDTALELFRDDFQTPSHKANAFYAKDDYMEFGKRIGIKPVRVAKILEKFVSNYERMANLVESSFLEEETKGRYLALVKDRLKRLTYSYSESLA